MQRVSWYLKRLKAMTATELVYRTRSEVRDRVDWLALMYRREEYELETILVNGSEGVRKGFRVAHHTICKYGSLESHWAEERLLVDADRVAAGRLSFFGQDSVYLGDPINWHRDHRAGVLAPKRFAPSIDYRDFRETGDCKQVWEPNRHHQFVVLARAYHVTRNVRYAEALIKQWLHWIAENPYGIGMNWRSPLELGIRLINWVWAMDLIRDAGAMTDVAYAQVMNSVYRHIWEIARKFSRGSSANNHLIGEAAGVYIACRYWPGLRNTEKWRRRSREILLREIHRQTNPDGGNKEQALGYQLFVLQFFLLSGLVGRWSDDEFPREYWDVVERMCLYIGAMSEGGPNLPLYGDCDDGYVLDLGCDHHDFRAWLSAAAVLFRRPELKRWSGQFSEPAWWLLGEEGREAYDGLSSPDDDGAIVSRAFPETGYYLLQTGHHDSVDRISVVFDCGPLGMGALAAHGHADALSFTLRAFGEDVFVDPGTYDYFTFPAWRGYFRSTRAHNTLQIDSRDQSEMLGPFLWGKRARARCLEWTPTDAGGKVVGEHDGYARLRRPAIHRRTLELEGPTLTITDEVQSEGLHDLALRFHLGERCSVKALGENRFRIAMTRGTAVLAMDPKLKVDILTASEDPTAGWVSRGYHQRSPSTTLVGCCRVEGPAKLVSTVELSAPMSEKPGRGSQPARAGMPREPSSLRAE